MVRVVFIATILFCCSIQHGFSQLRFTVTPLSALGSFSTSIHFGLVPKSFGLSRSLGHAYEFGQLSVENTKGIRYSLSCRIRLDYVRFRFSDFAKRKYDATGCMYAFGRSYIYVLELSRLALKMRKKHMSRYRGWSFNGLIYASHDHFYAYADRIITQPPTPRFPNKRIERAWEFEIERINPINFELGYQWAFQFHTGNNSGDVGQEFLLGIHFQLPDIYRITEQEIRSNAPDPRVFHKLSFPHVRVGISTRFLGIVTFHQKSKD